MSSRKPCLLDRIARSKGKSENKTNNRLRQATLTFEDALKNKTVQTLLKMNNNNNVMKVVYEQCRSR